MKKKVTQKTILPPVKQMTSRGCVFSLIGALTIMAIIAFGGLYMARSMERSFQKEVDANGLVIKATIENKYSNSKGYDVVFSYWYKNKKYRAIQLSRDAYEQHEIGDTVLIIIDTLHPGNAYLYSY